MIDRTTTYLLLYALIAREGREAALFGGCSELARKAFSRSLAGDCFPELWFELPLLGEPGFDLHALVSREDLDPAWAPSPDACGGCPEAFAWFAAQDRVARQLALSWDVRAGDVETPAVQLLVDTRDAQVTCGFLEAVGRADATGAYRAFVGRLPQGWFACYAGVFPRRATPFLRVECLPDARLQAAYAENPALLEKHLRQVGVSEFGDTVLPRCQELAAAPFALEFQFDVEPDGAAGPTLGASVRFAPPPGSDACRPFDPDAEAGRLMGEVEAWGLADGRWRLLADTMFAKRASFADEATSLFCFPAFVKLRWRGGEPLDAKAYLKAGAR